MKRFISLSLVFLIAFSCCACGKEVKKGKKKKVIVIDREVIIEQEKEDNSNSDNNEDFFFEQESSPQNSYLKKETASDIGKNYYVVLPESAHPGVVGMDAVYNIKIYDKQGYEISIDKLKLTSNIPQVKVEGLKLTVPYSVRAGSQKLTINVQNKTHSNRTGKYTFDFHKFTPNPTFSDDFEKFDNQKWEYASYQGEAIKEGTVENGELVFRMSAGNESCYLNSLFTQAFGCFSARVMMPDKGLVKSVFQLGSDEMYIKNKQYSRQSGGAINVVEYFPYWKDKWSASVRWNGWLSYTKRAADDQLVCKNISSQHQIYSVVWTPKAIYWYLNGELMWEYSGDGVSPNSGELNMRLLAETYDSDYYLGGPYEPDASDFAVKYDWIKVYGLQE